MTHSSERQQNIKHVSIITGVVLSAVALKTYLANTIPTAPENPKDFGAEFSQIVQRCPPDEKAISLILGTKTVFNRATLLAPENTATNRAIIQRNNGTKIPVPIRCKLNPIGSKQ